MKPKVLHIIDSFEQGGTERQALQLVRLLQASNRYHVHLACLNNRGILRDEAERLGLGEIVEYPLSSFYDRNFLTQIRRCQNFLNEQEIDVVHTHDFYTNVFGMTAAKLARTRARIASKRETEGFRSSNQKVAERWSFRFAHSVITNADAVKNQLIREGVPAAKLITIYNGLDIHRVTPRLDLERQAILALLNLPAEPERRFIPIVANLEHAVKDHPTFLRAAAQVRQAVPEATFVIAGEGQLMNELRALAVQLGIEEHTFFIGRCQHVAELLTISEVCVLSSKAEGFSNAILEYMAAGRPVVATDVGGAREAVREGETGYLVAAGDDQALATRIITLLHQRERAREMGRRGKLIVEEKFSIQVQLERTLALYDSLLARPVQVAEPALKNLRSKRA